MQGAIDRYYRDPESARYYRMWKYQENHGKEKYYMKKKHQENPKSKKNIKI